ncbi:IniB N-terminal domain-containing protein [Catelliglobosispora koreensis]|uniref:IniB N-terminal domain-containing protein n=1 Tax=Catelliglobosispora koreensis TaxID=129052 RepID=UPI00035FCDE1|nr:IniB N-terminal domain-containing protein [Catelliglobosispora koreensis]
MDSTPTLHDFVLNLITNQDARLAFELDPEGALQDARLGDLTPADVQDVIPLVVDLTPVQGLLPAPVNTLDLGALPVDPAAAAGQLQQLIQHLPIPTTTHSASADVNVAALGAITVDPVASNLDVFHTLDALPTGGLGNGLPLDSVTSLTGGLTGSVTGDLTGDLTGGVTGDLTGGSATVLNGDLTSGLLNGGLTNGLTGGLTDTVSGLTGGLTEDLTATVDGTLDSTLGTVSSVTGTIGLDLSAGGHAHASTGGGLLGLTDGLL